MLLVFCRRLFDQMTVLSFLVAHHRQILHSSCTQLTGNVARPLPCDTSGVWVAGHGVAMRPPHSDTGFGTGTCLHKHDAPTLTTCALCLLSSCLRRAKTSVMTQDAVQMHTRHQRAPRCFTRFPVESLIRRPCFPGKGWRLVLLEVCAHEGRASGSSSRSGSWLHRWGGDPI